MGRRPLTCFLHFVQAEGHSVLDAAESLCRIMARVTKSSTDTLLSRPQSPQAGPLVGCKREQLMSAELVLDDFVAMVQRHKSTYLAEIGYCSLRR
jgi:hypothetical protein